MKKLAALVLVVVTGCSSAIVQEDPTTTGAPSSTTQPATAPASTAPQPTGALDPDAQAALDDLLAGVFEAGFDTAHLGKLVEAGDVRTAWVLADLLRFYQVGPQRDELVAAFSSLTGAEQDPAKVDFVWATDDLLSTDTPVWDGYTETKGSYFGALNPLWQAFFDEGHDVDWRLVTWGGVLPDERPLGDNGPCNCIPALDYPETTDAAGGNWYADDRIVFGVVVGDEALALPKHQMEVHEMVNTTLGGRELGIPYCTLCASAQAYYVDDVAGTERVVLRTSGLLSRSNKLMYDQVTKSAIDTFTGKALTGSLAEADVTLAQVSVVASTWGDWKTAHPDTRILAEDGGIGRTYRDDPLGGRDDNGPIFPVGDVDPRLPIQELVVGVTTPSGTPIAFPVEEVTVVLENEGELSVEDVVVRLTDGVRVYTTDGRELPTHQAFWFAWSQFHPGTVVWEEG